MRSQISKASTFLQPSLHVFPDPVDLSRGARQFGIRESAVFLEEEVLDTYAELDAALGQNAAGAILSVLSCRLAEIPGCVSNQPITVCLLRRQDVRPVQVDLEIQRFRRLGGNCLLLSKIDERSVEVHFD